jgi:hypothetical protein
VYGGLKGFMYYKAKRTVDQMVSVAAGQADISYAGIDTELLGAVTVRGIQVLPRGYADAVTIDRVRVASDDPLFFFRSSDWEAGQQEPPSSLSFAVGGIALSLSSDFMRAATDAVAAVADEGPLCAQGLQMEPEMLRRIGITDVEAELDAHYRLDKTARTLEVGMNMEMHDIESLHVEATLADVDVQALENGGMPQVSLGGFSVAMRVNPEFGRKALEACAAGTEQGVLSWSRLLADRAIEDLERQGIVLGAGLSEAVKRFYHDWGEVKLVSAPQQPLGLLSMIFLPPEQLADALSLRVSVNDKLVTDNSFRWQGPAAQDLSSLFGADQPEREADAQGQRRRVLVRREFEPVAVGEIGNYIDHQVHIKPRGQPLREGVLKRIKGGAAEVEQNLHGGKYTVYVPLRDIESMQALVQREVAELQ